MQKIVLDPEQPRRRQQALRQHHKRQLGYVETEPSRRLGSGAEITSRPATAKDRGASGSTIAMATFAQLERAQKLAHLTCGQCFEHAHEGACYQD